MKKWLLSLVALGVVHGAMAAVCVTNVTATFQTRAEGVVEIAYEVTSDDPDADVWLMFEGWDRDRGLAVFPKTLSGDGTRGPVKPGMHSTVWHVAADRPSFHSSAFCLKVTAVTGLSPYRILDLSGDSASGFSVHDAAQGPSFADDSQYTTNLWMRLVLPGTFIMGSPDNEIGREKTYNNERQHQVTLTQPYYIGVIQTTRKQWALVTGAPVVPSSSGRKTETEETLRLPEDDVSYDMIRGTDLGAQWPSSQDVDADSFIGMLRSRTSRLYDLPTEAQWEYACRAGTTTALNSGKDLTSTNHCPNMVEVGRYGGNRNDDGVYWNCTIGGKYQPNNWGLFDMHGNGCEWCLDRDGYISSAAVVDPKGNSTSSASMRVCRKGSFTSGADRHRSAQRFSTNSKSRWGTSLSFRLVEHLEAPEGFSFWGVESNEFRLELRDVETLDESLEDGSVVEAGRLLADTVWSNDVVHVIRDWVTVPSGVTLTIVPGTTVKFYNDSGIWVMGGGIVCAHGEEGAPISFKSIDSSTPADWRVVTVNDGEWLSNEFLSADNVPCDDGSVTISSATDKVLVSCDWSAPPGSPIVITWQTLDGTAKAGIDYTEVSGCVTQEWPYASFYVEVPVLLPDEQKNDREFAVEFRADGAGINAVWTRKVVLYDSVLVARKDVSVGDECVSGGCFVDLRGIGETIKVEGDREIAYDTAWDGSADGVEVKVIAPDGRERTIVAESGDASGIVRWTPDAGSGCYIMEHRTSGGLLTARMAVPDAACARVGTRRLTTAETWTADKVYLVDGELTIADGGSLTIQPGTVVKFTPGSKLLTVNGGVCEAPGVTFTHVNDDSVGGDTLCDGNQSYPVAGQYTISGRVLDDDATVYRYMGAIMTLWTINTDTVWHSGQVYVLLNSLVISNATLKIMPGVTVKIAKGKSITVRDDGRIDASGTRAQPIVFTSMFDDAYGGDTNGDGDNTLPQPGDWARIHNYGEVALRNCKILYASSGGMGGAVCARKGRVTVVDSEIAHSAYDAIGVETGGDAFITNCVIRDALAAFRHYNTNEIVNCVVYDCGRITQAGNHKFRNCVFSEITDVWQSGQQPNNFRNCCFWNKGGTKLTGDVAWQVDQTQIVTQDASVYLNRNGNVWGDPLFADPMNGDFRIQEGSACVDAADGTVVPETDLYGQPRVTLLGEPSGSPTPEGCVPDIGVSELMPRNMSADVDFEARRVTAAGPVAPGDEITVKWTVGNLGGREVDGSWRDTVSLVSANGHVVTLGEKVTTGRVPAGGSIVCSGSFTVPTLAEGTWYPKVQVNTYRDVFEGSLTENNAVQGTDPVEVSVAAADMSAAVAGRILAGVPTVLKLPFTEDASNRLVRMTLPEGVTASWGFGFMPTTGRTGGSPVQSGGGVSDGHDVLFLAPDGEQTVYVVLESGATVDYSLTFEDNPLVISSISPTSIPKSGTTSIIVTGAGFTPSNTVSFTSASGAVAPESVRYVNANTLVATVDCGKFTSGATYATETSVGVLASTLPSVLVVTDEEGKGELDVTWAIPGSVRIGRVFSFPITVENIGNADVGCPMVSVSDSVTTNDCPIEFSLDGEIFTPGGFQFISKDTDGGFDGLKVGDKVVTFVYARVPAGNPGASAISIYANTENDDMAEFRTEVDRYLTPEILDEYESTTNNDVKASVDNLKKVCGHNNGEFVRNIATVAKKYYDCNGLALQQVEGLIPYGIRLLENSSSDEHDVPVQNQVVTMVQSVQATQTTMRLMSSHARDLADQARRTLGLNPTTGAYIRKANGGYAHLEDDEVDLSGQSVLIVAHGMNDGLIVSSWMREIGNALASEFDQVIYVNWQAEANTPDVYPWGASKHIGAVATFVVAQLNAKGFNSPKNSVCVGHSFGAHLTGVISRMLGKFKRHIGLDTADTAAVPDGYEIRKGDADVTEYYRSSSFFGRDDAYAHFNYIVCKKNGFDFAENNHVAMGGNHSYAWQWFVHNLRSSSSRVGYWSDGKAKDYFKNKSGYLGVICGQSGQSLECVYPFEDRALYPAISEIHYPGFKGKWSTMRDAWAKTVDLAIKVSDVHDNMTFYTGEEYGIHVGITDNIDIYSSATMSHGISKIYHLTTFIRNLDDTKWEQLDYQFRMHPEFDLKLKIPHGYGVTNKTLKSRIRFRIQCDMKNAATGNYVSYTDLYTADNEKIFNVNIKKAHNPIAKINGRSHNDFVLKKTIRYSSRKKFNEACSKGETFEYDFEAHLSEVGEKRKIASYAWRDSYSWLWGWGSVVSKKETYEKKYSATSCGSHPIMLTVTDDAGFSSTVHGHLNVTIDVKPDGDPIDNPKSKDPNEMVGPMGKGDPNRQRFVEPGQMLTYTVYYENDASATAAAQEVFVTNSLSQYLDWSTFEMGEVAFGDQIDLGLVGKQDGTNEVTMTGTNLIVRSIVDLDKEKGEVRWYMRVVDPDSGDTWPADVTGGFLPPNDKETHCGEGHLTYRIKVRDDAPRGVRIDNSATIVFDTEDPIETDPAWWNLIATHQDVSMTVDGVATNLDLIVGMPYGELPTPSAWAGHTFGGWYTGPNGTGRCVTAQSLVEAGDSNLYAYWLTNAYAVHFEPNGGEGLMSDQAFEFDKPGALDSNAFVRAYHDFAGWATNETGEAIYADGATVTNLTEIDGGVVDLYATWTRRVHEVNFYHDKALDQLVESRSVGEGLELDVLPEPPEATEGYSFVEWRDVTSAPETIAAAPVVSLDTVVLGDMTVCGVWTANVYTITFDANGGEVSPVLKQVEYDSEIGELPTPTRDGYTFEGWLIGGETIASDTVYETAGDSVAVAQWTKVPDTEPTPEPVPAPTPDPTPTPDPEPSPTPTPDPVPDPVPTPQPEPTPELEEVYELYEAVEGTAPSAAACEYNGYLFDEKRNVTGTILIKVGKPNKKTGLAAVKANVVLGVKKFSLKAVEKGKAVIASDGPTVVDLVGRGAEACSVTLGAKGLSGSYGSYKIDGARNFFTSKDKAEQAAADGVLGKWLGAVNVVWSGGSVNVAIAKKGKAKVKGTLADGKTKVSANAVFLVGEEWCCVPVVAPKAGLAFAVWLQVGGGARKVVEGLGDGVLVGKPGTLKGGAAFHMDAAAFASVFGQPALPYLPDGVSVSQNGAKWVVADGAKAGKLAMKNGVLDDSKAGKNPSGLKLTYKAKEGSFKGSFKAYADVGGKLKATTVTVTGYLVDGVGYGTATVKGKGSVSVEIK